jgi:Co-chaperonin GroES (HSP10)
MERRGTSVGILIAIGMNAWKGFANGEPWAKVGDEVVYSKYAGVDADDELRRLFDPTAERLVYMNDEDIIAIVRRYIGQALLIG